MSPPGSGDHRDRSVTDRRTVAGVVLLTILGLAIRLYDLGGRVFHWDEGRVGYWTLRYAETGHFEYEPIIHGPFLRIVNGALFGVLPPTDASARLVVALVGGILPLGALLFRAHLDRLEVVTLAAFLSLNPLLVYYSRFMRNDVLVGAFAFLALGFVVRALDTRQVRHLYAGSALLALSLSTKANTILYVLCFLGAGALLVDHRLARVVRRDGLRSTAVDWAQACWRGLVAVAGDRHPVGVLLSHVVGIGVVFLAIIVFFYAPRPDLYRAIGSPEAWSGVLHEATVGSVRELVDLWIKGDMQDNPYLTYLGHELETIAHAAAVTAVLAVVGFIVDGHVRGRDRVPAGRNRAFVAFAAYWGIASLIGYPAATDINAPWSAVHIVLPATIPAAVGLAYVLRECRAAIAIDDSTAGSPTIHVPEPGSAAIVLLIALTATGGLLAPTATYWNSTNSDHTAVVQWAQPHNDASETIADIEAIASHHGDGTDVLFVGADVDSRDDTFYVADESDADEMYAPGGWNDRLPLPWYLERSDARVDSISADADREEALADAPPVVIVHADARGEVEPHLDGYRVREHQLRLWNFRIAFFLEEDALRAARSGE
ncbi:flippase activity-associated protein Agl23 [Halopenitus sp. H-Gu1]|uniref:flippase activity-associated protein Agl23 n=1 Tax=Halopenitus sp. H-Gu1 TaxID=3242697 RepID=UPI00359D8D88